MELHGIEPWTVSCEDTALPLRYNPDIKDNHNRERLGFEPSNPSGVGVPLTPRSHLWPLWSFMEFHGVTWNRTMDCSLLTSRVTATP